MSEARRIASEIKASDKHCHRACSGMERYDQFCYCLHFNRYVEPVRMEVTVEEGRS